MTADDRIGEIFSAEAEQSGISITDAAFFSPKEFQAVWRRRGNNVSIKISDYLSDAPDAALSEFACTLLDMVAGRKPTYGGRYMEWVTSDEFINNKRRIYIRRSKNLRGDHIGKEKDLSASLDRLLESGLIAPSDIDNSVFTWTSRPNVRRVGYCSPMMRVVAVSSALDDPAVPDEVADYVVYHETLHLRQGYRPASRAHDAQFREMERRFPGFKNIEAYLRRMGTQRRDHVE
ncbi:MAG: DUF45 domain-containing protein [Candidatus Methanoplasma sp.]|jgi:hypothetical protein|nr:DUF45 domain-containing protein [Candidatus Methanoplasma sp.]